MNDATDSAGLGDAGRSDASRNRAGQDGVEQHGAEQHGIGPEAIGPDGSGHGNALPAAAGEWASVLTRRVLAPNPGPMTLDGTNSYIIRAPGAATCVVVDPGPLDEDHLAELVSVVPVELVLITHHHIDHTEASAQFAAMTGAPVRALDPNFCVGGAPLVDNEEIQAGGTRIQVVATPGHSSDSVCFVLPDDGPRVSVLTGDTIMGRGTTIIAHPDGGLAEYLRSLEILTGFGDAVVLPAHGGTLPDLAAVCQRYRAHRLARLAEVRNVLATLGEHTTVEQITDVVYADTNPAIRFAAEASMRAQLEYLESEVTGSAPS